MKLYAIEDAEELKGETILDVRIGNTSVAILTDDGGIFTVRVIAEDYDYSIDMADSGCIKHDIAYDGNFAGWLLSTRGVIRNDLDDFAKQQLAQKREELKRQIKIAEQEERKTYLRLKAKYESDEAEVS